MNSYELHNAICELMNTVKTDTRPCIVTVTRAAYGKPSMVVIEWQGSPPWNQIVLNLSSSAYFPILVGCKVLRLTENTSSKYWRVRKLVMQFLEDGDYLGSGLSHPVHNTDEKLLTELERLKERTKQLYEVSVMLKTGQIDLALFGEFLNAQVNFDEVCQVANESDSKLEF